MDYQIYSFGNGEVLKGVFNAIALCLNSSSGSLYLPLIRISILIGAMLAVIYSLYGNMMRAVVGWIIPMTAIMQILFVPQVSVWITDPVSRYHQKVDHVPYGLAMVSSYISRIGYAITEQIEKVFVLPDDLKYQKTGTLFGSHLIQQAKTFHITNEDLAENMRQFVGQCVAYDALLGRKYTLSDLRHSANIWGLVSEKASPARSFLWREPKGEDGASQPEIITCKQGVELFNRHWSPELNQVSKLFGQKIFGNVLNPKAELLKYLPIAYGHLADMSQSAADILKQNIMIYAIVDGLEQKSVAVGNAPNFAVRRAYLQQRATYETLGAMAAETLPTMKSVLEAIAYASFLFVIPLALLPSGWRFLSSWVQVLLWLQMWAPLYAVLNYMMTLAARSKSIAALSLSNKAGVTIASSVGLANVNADIAAMAGYLAMSIPFLSIALVKGVGSFVHLASHLSNVTQGAASSAASDAVSGNYSLGNISDGNRQISNVGMLNHSYGASYRAGTFHQSDGRSDLTTAADGQQILNIASSNIPLSINAAETKTAQLSELASQSYQKASSAAESSSKSLGDAYRTLMDLSNNLSSGQQLSDQMSEGKTVEQTKAIQQASQMLEKFSKDNGLTFQESAALMGEVGVGINLGICRFGTNAQAGKAYVDQDTYSKAEELAKSQEFQTAMRAAEQASSALSHTTTNEETRRLSEGVSGSFEEANHFEIEGTKSFRAAEDYQNQAIYTKAFASSINANYNQEFVDWLASQKADNTGGILGKQGAGHIIANEPQLRLLYAQRFLNEKGLGAVAPTEVTKHEGGGDRLKSFYDSDTTTAVNRVTGDALNRVQVQGENIHFDKGAANILRQKVKDAHTTGRKSIDQSNSKLNDNYQHAEGIFATKKDNIVKEVVFGKPLITMDHPSLIPLSSQEHPLTEDKDKK